MLSPHTCEPPATMLNIDMFLNPFSISFAIEVLPEPQHRTRKLDFKIPQEKPDPDEIDSNCSDPDGNSEKSSALQHFTAPVPTTLAQIWLSPTDRFSNKKVSLTYRRLE